MFPDIRVSLLIFANRIYMTWICTIGSALFGDWLWWLFTLVRQICSLQSMELIVMPRSLPLERGSSFQQFDRCSQCSSLQYLALRPLVKLSKPINLRKRPSLENRPSYGQGWKKATNVFSRCKDGERLGIGTI